MCVHVIHVLDQKEESNTDHTEMPYFQSETRCTSDGIRTHDSPPRQAPLTISSVRFAGSLSPPTPLPLPRGLGWCDSCLHPPFPISPPPPLPLHPSVSSLLPQLIQGQGQPAAHSHTKQWFLSNHVQKELLYLTVWGRKTLIYLPSPSPSPPPSPPSPSSSPIHHSTHPPTLLPLSYAHILLPHSLLSSSPSLTHSFIHSPLLTSHYTLSHPPSLPSSLPPILPPSHPPSLPPSHCHSLSSSLPPSPPSHPHSLSSSLPPILPPSHPPSLPSSLPLSLPPLPYFLKGSLVKSTPLQARMRSLIFSFSLFAANPLSSMPLMNTPRSLGSEGGGRERSHSNHTTQFKTAVVHAVRVGPLLHMYMLYIQCTCFFLSFLYIAVSSFTISRVLYIFHVHDNVHVNAL